MKKTFKNFSLRFHETQSIIPPKFSMRIIKEICKLICYEKKVFQTKYSAVLSWSLVKQALEISYQVQFGLFIEIFEMSFG